MKCSRCGAEMKIKNVKVDTDIYGNAIYAKYAYCYHCKIKRNLGTQKTSDRDSRRRSSKRARKRKQKVMLISTFLVVLLAVIAGTCFFFLKKGKNDTVKKKETITTDTRKNKISAKSFSKLETGMTLQEVLDIIGTDGSKLMQTTSEDSAIERYQWVADKGNGTVLLTFKDEKLVDFSQMDMKPYDSVTLSDESIQKIKSDMSYEDVKTVLGTGGTLISETAADGITTTMYTWYDSKSKPQITVIFQDGKVKTAN